MDHKSIEDLSVLSRESIINEYFTLYNNYTDLKQSDQKQLQQIYQLRRELQTALNDKNHLSSELEIINSEHAKEIEAIQEKHREDLQECKDRILAYKDELELIENARDDLEAKVLELEKDSGEEKAVGASVPEDNNQSLYAEKLSHLESENDELAEAVEQLQAELTEALKLNVQSENKIEDLMDRLHCAEENLQAKRDELEEKNQMYETAQEQVIQLNGELNALRSESDTASKRGNSLFAEVDDQRQKMKALLIAQKANYIEMKNELEKSQQEIRKLKRENTAMYKEMEVCSHMFLNAEQHHTEKLNERIAELMKENEAISKKLVFTEECLSDMIKKNDVKWLDPMLALCKNESNDLKDKLYRCSLQKVEIAGTLREREEESARWRFEALKSRCIIADRESLLEDNKIPFGAISDMNRRIRKIDNDNVSPIIACRPSMLGFKRRSMSKSQSEATVNTTENGGENTTAAVKPKIEVKSPPKSEALTNGTHDGISTANKNEETIAPNTEPVPSVVETEFVKPQEVKIEKKFMQQSTSFSGVTIRKKTNVSSSTLQTPKNRFDNLAKSPGILKPSSTPNINSGKKVKFDNGSAVAKKNIEKPGEKSSSERKADENVPKTAIKKRIFISSKKPANNS